MCSLSFLEPWELEISTKTLANVCGLLGSRHGGIYVRWDDIETQGRVYLLHYWTITLRRGSKSMGSWSRYRTDYRSKYD